MRNVAFDRWPFDANTASFLLDTFMVATQEISVNVLNPLGGGRGDTVRDYIDAISRNRRNIAISLDRVIAVAQKPTDYKGS